MTFTSSDFQTCIRHEQSIVLDEALQKCSHAANCVFIRYNFE